MTAEEMSAMAVAELERRARQGEDVDPRAMEVASSAEEMAGYVSMGVAECADLLLSLARVGAL